jgi:precorrin-6A/cobalt-precorrin-6A reductase
MKPTSLLILGGTAEASALARAVAAQFGEDLRVTTSFAGRTLSPGPVPGFFRSGGFGGPEGLFRYLIEGRIDRVIDATHPFATRISAAARLACERADIPRLVLLRPPWRRDPQDRWIEADGMEEAAEIVGRLFRCAFLTVGASGIAAFASARGVRFVVRLIEAPREPLLIHPCELLLDRGPFTLAGERRILERYPIDVLVSKASGGAATEAKILAAREHGLPVVMIRRPPAEPGPTVASIGAALDWLEHPQLASHTMSVQ